MEESAMKEELSTTISASTKRILEGLLLILSLLYSEEYMNDYHVVLTKEFKKQISEAPVCVFDGLKYAWERLRCEIFLLGS